MQVRAWGWNFGKRAGGQPNSEESALLIIAAFMRATALVIAGYFVWFASTKAEDRLKTVGKYIAIWTFAFAAVLVIIGIAGAVMRPMEMGRPMAMYGGPRMMGMGPGMHPGMGPMGMHRGFGDERGPRFMFRERMGQEPPKADVPAAPPPAAAPPAKP